MIKIYIIAQKKLYIKNHTKTTLQTSAVTKGCMLQVKTLTRFDSKNLHHEIYKGSSKNFCTVFFNSIKYKNMRKIPW